MEFWVLGPLRVVGPEGPVEVRGAKERLLLAHLVARAGRTVGVDDLVDGLWGDQPPRTAAKSLQTYVLRLRNTLEPERAGSPALIVTEGRGYRLDVDPGRVDARRFEQLLGTADRVPRAERLPILRQALDLWRGSAYAGLWEDGVLRAEATRLEELRLSAVEERHAVDLDLGSHRAVVAEVERLLTDHPLRERLWGLLVTALYREGRQAEALGAYERARAVLAEELGIDPGPELRALHAQVLAQDPALDGKRVDRALPSELQVPSTGVHGRGQELAALRGAWERARSGERTVVAVRGPVGAGARTLAGLLAREVAAAGGAVAYVDPRGGPGASSPTGCDLVVLARGCRPDRSVTSSAALTIHLTGPDDTPPAGAQVVDLGPLDRGSVREVVAEHVGAAEVDAVTDEVWQLSGGWPGRARAAVVGVVRATAAAAVRSAAEAAGSSSGTLREARARLVDGVLDLGTELPGSATDPGRCPWPGLAPYGVEDGPWFAGRERLVAELVARTAGATCLAVVGASGSGKSSLVRAGLLPALAAGHLPGSSGWEHLVMRPGPHPMRELAHLVLGARKPDPGAILERLVRADGAAGAAGERTLLVVDQLEEAWTTCDDEGERAAFLDTLAEVAAAGSHLTLVLVLRADFVDRLADHRALAGLVAENSVLVGAPTPDDVRRAVERPARRGGLVLDDGLVDAIVDDAGSEPGLLPLLSTALAQLWAARAGNRMTFAEYVALGGLPGAIAHLAEDAWSSLDERHRAVARSLLLRLTGPGDGSQVTRRRVALAELAGLPSLDVSRVVGSLADARLLTVSGDSVEVAHEALFREWPRLRGWLAEDAAGRAVQRRLAVATVEWEAEDRDPALLWRGARLEAGLDVVADRPEEATESERAFLDAGRATAEEARRRAEQDAAAKARQNRRLRFSLAGLAALLVLVLVTAALAMVARGSATEAAARADREAVAADARRLAASALSIEYPDLALLAAVEATELEQDPETFGALLTLLARQPDVLTRYRTSERFLRVGTSPDGRTVFVSENASTLRALDARTGDQLWVRDDLAGQVGRIAVRPDGRAVAVTLLSEPFGSVELLDAVDGRRRWRIDAEEAAAFAADDSEWPGIWYGLGWTSADRLVLGVGGHVVVADVRGRLVHQVAWGRPVLDTQSFEVWPDGRVSTGSSEAGPGVVMDLATGSTEALPATGSIAAVHPDGRTAVVVAEAVDGATLRLVDTRTGRPRSRTWSVEGFVHDVAFARDGRGLAVAADERVLLRDPRTGGPLRALEAHSGTVMGLAYAGRDADVVWTAGRDGSAVALDASGAAGVIGTVPTRDSPHSGESSPSGVSVWTDWSESEPNAAYLRLPGEARGERLPLTGLEDCTCQATSTEVTPDGGVALAGMLRLGDAGPEVDRGHVVVWDVATRRVRAVVDTPWPVIGVGATPDGRRAVLNGYGGWAVLDLEDLALDGPVVDLPGEGELGMPEGTASVEVSGTGDRAVLLRGTEVLLLDLAGREVLARAQPDSGLFPMLLSAAWTHDSRAVAIGTLRGYLHVLDGRDLDAVAPPRLITGGFVVDIEVGGPGGTTAATMGSDGDVTLWDTTSWKPYGLPVVDDRGWGFLSLSRDVLTVDYEDGSRTTVAVRPEAWVEAACAAANRELTAEEAAVVLGGLDPSGTCAA